MKKYNAYDFDETIFDGDCSRGYYFYALKKYPFIALYLPYQAFAYLIYKLGLRDSKWVKQCLYIYYRHMKPERDIPDFWNKNQHRIKKYYLAQKQDDDIIISASPEPLVAEMCKRLGLTNIIGTDTDMRTGKITGHNCYGEGKVKVLAERMGDVKISEFYSDSYSDTPMARLAERAYLVTGEELRLW